MAESSADEILTLDLLIEILVRLPAKPLMRFKSVSKKWLALITHPFFVEMHRSRAYARDRGVLLVNPPSECGKHPHSWDRRFFMIDWRHKDPKNRAFVHDPSLPFTTNCVSNIANGLICFYHGGNDEGCISIYNLSTRENLPLPCSPTLHCRERSCYLGFDPVKKVYKVLQMWCCADCGSLADVECQVFTLGCRDNKWRSIKIPLVPDAHRKKLESMSHCCNDGFLYWTWTRLYWPKTKEDVLVKFNVDNESFDVINYPPDVTSDMRISFAKIRGCLSLVGIPDIRYDYSHIKITRWRLIDRKDNLMSVWAKDDITCPLIIWCSVVKVCCNNSGVVSCVSRCSRSENEAIIECYNLGTGKFMKLRVNNAQEFLSQGDIFCPSKVVDNIMPLKNIEERDILDIWRT